MLHPTTHGKHRHKQAFGLLVTCPFAVILWTAISCNEGQRASVVQVCFGSGGQAGQHCFGGAVKAGQGGRRQLGQNSRHPVYTSSSQVNTPHLPYTLPYYSYCMCIPQLQAWQSGWRQLWQSSRYHVGSSSCQVRSLLTSHLLYCTTRIVHLKCKPGRVEDGSSGRTADTLSAPQTARYTPFPPA